ncbi:MAG: hypothetical protein ACI9ZF_003358, partial [Bradyrhizobium sp.]
PFFLLRQKVSNQEKGDREAAALRVPKSRSQSGGGPQTRFAQTCVPLIPCLTPTFGSCLNAEQVKVKTNGNRNRNRNRNRNYKPSALPLPKNYSSRNHTCVRPSIGMPM